MKHLHILTNSSRLCYQECPQKYYLRNVLEIVARIDRDALTFGTACHEWLDPWWSGKPTPLIHLSDPYQEMKLKAMLVGYDIRWFDWRKQEGVAVAGKPEMEFRVPLVNPDTGARSTFWAVAGKIDVPLMIRDTLWIGEHKTSSDTDPSYFERLRLCSQISTYLMAAESLGLGRPAGVLYDVLKKPQLKPLKASEDYRLNKDGSKPKNKREFDETPDEYYTRCLESIGAAPQEYYQHYEVVRLESEVERAARDLWFVAASIRESMGTGRWPMNPGSCRTYKRMCEYWPICSGRSNPEDSTMYEHRSLHSELSEGTRK